MDIEIKKSIKPVNYFDAINALETRLEELNENIPPPELNEDADIYLFQEWQTQEKSGKRLNDLVIQTQRGTSLYGKNRYL